jgi:hypothetical protein
MRRECPYSTITAMSDFEDELDDACGDGGFVRLSRADASGDIEMTNAPFEGHEPDSIVRSIEYSQGSTAEAAGQPPEKRRFIIAVDFGTTTSTVAFVCVRPGEPQHLIPPERVLCVDHYPDVPAGVTASVHAYNTTVPTELLYKIGRPSAKRTAAAARIESDIEDGYDSPLDDGAQTPARSISSPDEDMPPPPQKPRPTKTKPVWGYGVQKQLSSVEDTNHRAIHMSRFKLLLDEGVETRQLRQSAEADLKALKDNRLAAGPVDVIADYLEHLFKHSKRRLVSFHDLKEDDIVQFVLCVPTMWTEKACRIMQDAMMKAIVESQLGRLENGGIKDLFIVSEPEAAAAWALNDSRYASRIFPGETFLVLDCGGGTVDAISKISCCDRGLHY